LRQTWQLNDCQQLVSYERIPVCTTGYILTAKGAQKLLKNVPPFGRPVDLDICNWWEFDLNVVGLKPYPIQANYEHQSMIGKRSSLGFFCRMKRSWLHHLSKKRAKEALVHQPWLEKVLSKRDL
jgi:glycosyl transferase family 25